MIVTNWDAEASRTRVQLMLEQAGGLNGQHAACSKAAREYGELREDCGGIHGNHQESAPSLGEVIDSNAESLRMLCGCILDKVGARERADLSWHELDLVHWAARRLMLLDLELDEPDAAADAARVGARMGSLECAWHLYERSSEHTSPQALEDLEAIRAGGLEANVHETADRLGDCFVAAGRFEDARDAYRRSIDLNGYGGIYSAASLALLEIRAGEYEDAEKHHRWVIERLREQFQRGDSSIMYRLIKPSLDASPIADVRRFAMELFDEWARPSCPACMRASVPQEGETRFGPTNLACAGPEGCGCAFWAEDHEVMVRSVGEFLTITRCQSQDDINEWFYVRGLELDVSIYVESNDARHSVDGVFDQSLLDEADPDVPFVIFVGTCGAQYDDFPVPLCVIRSGVRQLEKEELELSEALEGDEDDEEMNEENLGQLPLVDLRRLAGARHITIPRGARREAVIPLLIEH